jgi:Ca2+:H+ antiporter
VLLCLFIPGANLTLVFPPLLVIVIVLAAVVPMMAISDGESNWLEGVALIGLYAIVAAAFWWG